MKQVAFGIAGKFADLRPDFINSGLDGTVEDDAQGALIVVLHEKHDSPEKVGVLKTWSRDEKMALKRTHLKTRCPNQSRDANRWRELATS